MRKYPVLGVVVSNAIRRAVDRGWNMEAYTVGMPLAAPEPTPPAEDN